MPSGARLSVDRLVYRYPDGRAALDGISLEVEPGECLGIIGRSGAGKSTFLLHLNGILLPSAGALRIDDTPVTAGTLAAIRRRVGIVFQHPDDQLFTPTVGEDVAFGPRNLGLSEEQTRIRVTDALGRLGLAGFESRSTQELSFGEKRRAALATVLAMEPDLIGFDEPFANNDPATVEQLIATINALPATVVLVSQEILPALACADRLAVFEDGRLAALGPTFEIARDRALLARTGTDFHFFGQIWEQIVNA